MQAMTDPLLSSALLSIPLPSLDEIRASLARDELQYDPVSWIRTNLNETLWSKQVDIVNSVRDNRRTAVQSCHNIGKSYLAARIALWWLESHKPGDAFVVTSAPTGRQVRAILWREIGRAHARGKLSSRCNQTEIWQTMPAGNEEMIAFGQKPSDLDPSAFQGIHARYVLVIFDEACGIPKSLWEAADTLISNESSRFLAIGNPDDPVTEFCEVCKPGSGWNVIRVSAFDSPNFTSEVVPTSLKHLLISPVWVEEKRRKWGESNPLFVSKVLGEFPEIVTDGIISMQWIRAAQERTLLPEFPSELGIDVGGGGDASTFALRRGPVVRIVREDHNPNTMETLGNVLRLLRETGASIAKIDNVGIGRGAADRAIEISKDQRETKAARELAAKVSGVNVGQSARDKEAYANLRAEGYWTLRDRFEAGAIDLDPDDDDTLAQLVDIRYKVVSGRIQVESKDDMKRRGKQSPNRADAVMLAFISASIKQSKGAVW